MSIAELPSVTTGPAAPADAAWQDALTTVDRELVALHRAVDASRHNAWQGADAMCAEFDAFLDTIVHPVVPGRVSDTLPPSPGLAGRRNPWRDTIEAWEQIAGA